MSVPIQFRILKAGHCTVHEVAAMRGAPWRKVQIPALFALLEHPEEGPMVVDTGYAPFLAEASRDHWPIRLYRRLIPLTVPPQESAAEQLRRLGHVPEEIANLIVTHFHPDHIAGLRDFPRARFHYLEEAYTKLVERSWIAARSKGFFPELLPDDFTQRLLPRGLAERTSNPAPFDRFEPGIDLFGDGSVRGIPLPGHAVGQMGLVFTDSDDRTVFLCVDACWYSQSYRERRPPPIFTAWFLDSWRQFRQTFDLICDLHEEHPEILILPAHCPEVLRDFVR